jgi:hypothetical protein
MVLSETHIVTGCGLTLFLVIRGGLGLDECLGVDCVGRAERTC